MKPLAAALALATLAAAPAPTPAPATLAATALKGAPVVKAGQERGVFVWGDEKGLHVRWSSDGKHAVFAGSLELDKPVGKLDRVNTLAGGWVQIQGERIVMFSATAKSDLDGFDVAIPSAGTAKLDVQIDGVAADPAQVSFGDPATHAKSLPVKFPAK